MTQCFYFLSQLELMMLMARGQLTFVITVRRTQERDHFVTSQAGAHALVQLPALGDRDPQGIELLGVEFLRPPRVRRFAPKGTARFAYSLVACKVHVAFCQNVGLLKTVSLDKCTSPCIYASKGTQKTHGSSHVYLGCVYHNIYIMCYIAVKLIV